MLQYLGRAFATVSLDSVLDTIIAYLPIPLNKKEWNRRCEVMTLEQRVRAMVLRLHKVMIANRRHCIFVRGNGSAEMMIYNRRLHMDTFDAGYIPIFTDIQLDRHVMPLLTSHFTNKNRWSFFEMKKRPADHGAHWNQEDCDQATFVMTNAWYKPNVVVWKLLRVLLMALTRDDTYVITVRCNDHLFSL